MLLCNSFSYC